MTLTSNPTLIRMKEDQQKHQGLKVKNDDKSGNDEEGEGEVKQSLRNLEIMVLQKLLSAFFIIS